MDKLKIEYVDINSIKPYKNNAKQHPKEQIEQIKKSIEQFGMDDPIGIWKDEIVEGHGRLIACKELGMTEVPIIRLDHLTDEERKAYTLAHNKLTMNSDFDIDILNEELLTFETIDMEDFGFDMDFDLDVESDVKPSETLNDKFVVPPFSILDTRQGYWQHRKNAWKSIGIASELGRDENLMKSADIPEYANYSQNVLKGVAPKTSIFDPVLCEIMYKWFNVDGGKIFDCFAGGSVRGIVASMLGYNYTGIDLRQEQIDANYKNADKIGVSPTWYCDDSLNADKYVDDDSCDMIFSCPPYADLEVYSDDPRDISNMEYEEFCNVYKKIIDTACRKLKKDRFAVFVVGDVRDKSGAYRNFIDYTKKCFNDNGLVTYNEAILVEQIGTGAMRVNHTFGNGRKMIKTHQNVLIFYKGNIKNIKNNYTEIKVDEDFINEYSEEE